jgi:YHS domain-containing protein
MAGFGYAGGSSTGSNTYNVTEAFDKESVVVVTEESELPAADGNGDINLVGGKLYYFDSIVVSNNSLVLGANTPIVGLHGGKSGFIHTGGDVAIKGSGLIGNSKTNKSLEDLFDKLDSMDKVEVKSRAPYKIMYRGIGFTFK